MIAKFAVLPSIPAILLTFALLVLPLFAAVGLWYYWRKKRGNENE